jgi:hypothetical protein
LLTVGKDYKKSPVRRAFLFSGFLLIGHLRGLSAVAERPKIAMLISLGYSCQTRFMIDALHPDLKRQVFDFNITSRPALIGALATDGGSLRHDGQTATTYTMPKEMREGVEVRGMFFWHDYPLSEDKLTLANGWSAKSEDVNSKYAMLWQRFSDVLRSDIDKTLVLSNAQHNLAQFTAGDSDFDTKFGLGRRAHDEITEALEAYGARNYRLKFLSRSLGDVEETADLQGDRFDHHFVGTMSLRTAPELAAHLLLWPGQSTIEMVAGAYEDGRTVVRPISGKVALIFDMTGDGRTPTGAISQVQDGWIAGFGGRDHVFAVASDDAGLRFSNGTRWVRSPV